LLIIIWVLIMIRKPLIPAPSKTIYINKLYHPMVRLFIYFSLFAIICTGVISFKTAEKAASDYRATQAVYEIRTRFYAQTLTARPTLTLTSTPTTTPTQTSTALPSPTSTHTPRPTICSEIDNVVLDNTSDGGYLQINCSNGVKFKVGPLSNGVYAVGPNRKFLVYCTNDGNVYTVRADEQSLIFLKMVRKELPFFRDNFESLQELSFQGEYPYYLVISNKYTAQSTTIQIPLRVSQ